MKKITLTVEEGVYEKLEKFATLRKMPVENVVARLLEKFAPITHTMVLEEVIEGYAEMAEEELFWANL